MPAGKPSGGRQGFSCVGWTCSDYPSLRSRERRKEDQPKAVAELERTGGEVPSSRVALAPRIMILDLTDKELTATGEIKPEVLAPMAKLLWDSAN